MLILGQQAGQLNSWQSCAAAGRSVMVIAEEDDCTEDKIDRQISRRLRAVATGVVDSPAGRNTDYTLLLASSSSSSPQYSLVDWIHTHTHTV